MIITKNNHIIRNTLILDLDNTIYPKSWGVMESITERMIKFIHLKSKKENFNASVLIEGYRKSFNSIAMGFYKDFKSDFDDFLNYSHDLDLNSFILPGHLKHLLNSSNFDKKFIFSSAPRNHIYNILNKFELLDEMDGIISIEDVNYNYKPSKIAFEMFYKKTGVDPFNSVFIDDCRNNIEMAKTFGSYTVHISENQVLALQADEKHKTLLDYLLNYSNLN